jgi:hypothetical protein
MASTYPINAAWSGTAPSDGQTVNGDSPLAEIPLLTDYYLLECLWGGAAHTTVAVADTSVSTSFNLPVLAPPFSTKCHIGIVAAGAGTVTIDGTYDIVVEGLDTNTSLGDAVLAWGPADGNLLAVTPGNKGAPVWQSWSFASPADVVVYSIIFRWTRVTTTL